MTCLHCATTIERVSLRPGLASLWQATPDRHAGWYCPDAPLHRHQPELASLEVARDGQ